MTPLNTARRALLELQECNATNAPSLERLAIIGDYLDSLVALKVESIPGYFSTDAASAMQTNAVLDKMRTSHSHGCRCYACLGLPWNA